MSDALTFSTVTGPAELETPNLEWSLAERPSDLGLDD
jgi:hypothetical protein